MANRITIGVLSPVTGGFYHGMVMEGITREVAAVGGRAVVLQTLDAGISADEVVGPPDFATPTAWAHLDGVISIAAGTQRNYLDRLRAAGKPVVLASDEIPGFAAPSAVPDNAGGIRSAVDHLVEHGHRRIGFAGNLVQSDIRARYDAYRASLCDHGIDPDPRWYFATFDNGELGGADVGRHLVSVGLPVTALIAATDRNAIGCMIQLADLGVAVPEDLAVVGFDGLDAGAYTQPTLSTVRQPADELGASSARLLLAQLRGDGVPSRGHVTPSQLVPRESCGCGGVDGVGSSDEDGGLLFWREEAKVHLEHSRRRERWMRQQYEIGVQLLDHERADPRRLDWLAATDVRGAYLALWNGAPSSGQVSIAGVYDPGDVLPNLVGSAMPVEQFPPVSLLELPDAEAGEVTIVLPVKGRGLDFGLLAVVGEVDTLSVNGRETHNQWAALLTAALEQQSTHGELRSSEERYSLWAVATDDGLWDWDLAAQTVYYSGRCMEMLGREYQDLTAAPSVWFDAIHPDDLERVRQAMSVAAQRNLTTIDVEHRVRGTHGEYRRVSCRALPVGAPGEPATRIVGSIHDIEPRKQLEEQLRRGALYDEVTDLPNRKLFLERLTFAIEQAHRSPDLQYAVVFLDLDGFKLVNDSLGHLVGDQLLAKTGERLRAALRGADLAARFGGDEFAVLLHGVGRDSILPIVERLQVTLAAPMVLDGHEVAVSASAGITTGAQAYTNAEDVLRDADTAMYHAKFQRRGSCAMFDGDMHAGAVRRLGLQSEIRQALDRGQFEVHYQPIVDLEGAGTDHFEALVRWRHPERGIVPPCEFLSVMEENGLIVPLGRWVVDEVCRQMAQWHEVYEHAVNVSVNVSDREFWDPGLLPHILDSLALHGLGPERLTLEITETVIMRKRDAARRIIEELHAAGISRHIDDFGTGTSSLHALHRFPVQALKIDRSFIHELDVDPRTTALVRIMVAMGRTLGVDVVAEGVETAAQLELLREMGCRYAQGIWFGAPVDGHTAARLLGVTLPRVERLEPLSVAAANTRPDSLAGLIRSIA